MKNRPVIIITGATNGLGRLAALEFARKGFRLGIIARNQKKVDQLRQEIDEAAPGSQFDSFLADLTSLRDVRKVGREIEAHYDRIDVLINNAGLHAFSQRITADGFAEMMAVNYLAPWVLTNALRDKLIASAPARVVTVASKASMHSGSIDPARDLLLTSDYTKRESSAIYGRSKLMDIMFTQELARRLAGTGVTANCCCPGFNTTGLGRELPFSRIIEKTFKALQIGDPRRGAGIILRLAMDPGFSNTSGGYFSVDGVPLDCPKPGQNKDIQAELWEATASLVEEALPSEK
jgi:NAD(P)-dependent dehydrogenase (short-subunit alcohol dehydrogenase family)